VDEMITSKKEHSKIRECKFF